MQDFLGDKILFGRINRVNIAVFASGKGTNLQAIINAVNQGKIKAVISLVITDRSEAKALGLAKKAGIETVYINPRDFSSREEFDKQAISYLEKNNVEMVVLAGFMRLLSPYFVKKYRNRIMNIHPSLLPAFKGTSGIKDAWEYGMKITGVTVHFINEDMDAGPIILQKPVMIEETDTLESLEEKIHRTEHQIYPEAINLFIEGRLEIAGRRVKIRE